MTFQGSVQGAFGFSGPLYAQVAAMLRGKIASSEWNSTAPIPNEVALAKTIGVSIGTMRKALEMLEVERLIERQQGRGTFVIEASEESELERFSNLVVGGAKVRARPATRHVEIVPASETELMRLGLQPGERVIRIVTRWLGDQGYAAREIVMVSASRFAGLENLGLPDGQLLFPLYRKRFRIVVAGVEERVTTCNANAEDAKALEVEIGSALVKIERTARERSGAVVELSTRQIHLGAAAYAVTMK